MLIIIDFETSGGVMNNEVVWTKTLLSVYRYLERIAGAIDKIVRKSALASCDISGKNFYYNNVFSISQKIIDLSQRKVTIINLKVLIEDVLKTMREKDAQILIERYFDSTKCKDIALSKGLSMRTVFRRLESAEQSFTNVLRSKGYCQSKLNTFLKDENWIKNTYLKIAQKDEDLCLSNAYIEKAVSM